jgi:hypothetical protein
MYVYTDLDPTGELWAKDVNLWIIYIKLVIEVMVMILHRE